MHRFPYDAFSIHSQISEVMLTLKRTGKHFNQPWGANDFVVLDAGKVIGRIMLHPQTPKDRPWFWTIVAREIPPSIHNRGYSTTREQVMADFKKQWSIKSSR